MDTCKREIFWNISFEQIWSNFCQFKLKFGTKAKSDMQNSIVMWTFSVVDQKHPFSKNLLSKFKTVSSKIWFWHWLEYSEFIECIECMQNMHFCFFVFVWKSPFWIRDDLLKTFVTHSGFWLLKGWQEGGWVNPSKKENLWRKSFFQLMLNEVLS